MANPDANFPSRPNTAAESIGGPMADRAPAVSGSARPNQRTSDHLANERTFLAWIRTSISIIGLGFVVAKFSVWLRELSTRIDQPSSIHHSGLSMPLGIALMIFGALLSLTAASRYRTVKAAIQNSQPA